MKFILRVEPEWPLLLGLVVFVAALWAQAGALAGVFYDDGIYLVLARSLAEGEGYRYLHLPGAPEAVHYPPAYPFLVSLLWRLWPRFPENLALFEVVDAAALAIGAVIIARQSARWQLPALPRALALLLAFTAFPLLAIVGVRFSEPLFLVFFAGSLALADREDASLKQALGAGALAALATLTRSLGLAAILGTTAAFLLRRRPRHAGVCAGVAIIGILPWSIWVMLHSGAIDERLATVYGSYADVVTGAGIGGLIASTDLRVFGPVARLLIPDLPGLLWWPLALAFGVVVVLGAVRLYPRARALVIALACYSAVVTAWPYAPDRFVWITLPWWLLMFGVGAQYLMSRRGWWRAAAVALVVVVALGYLPRQASSLSRRAFAETARRISVPFGTLIPTLVQEVDDDAVVASGDEALVHLYSGRTTVPAALVRLEGGEPVPLSASESRDFYCDYGVTHIFSSAPEDPVASVLGDLSQSADGEVEPLFEIQNGPALYRFRCPDE